jgi:predicted nuclease of predicted toxin-antitoxin system
MKFLVDAQLPYGIKQYLNSIGFDAIHTNDLPLKEKTPDWEINKISVEQNRVVITKDKDFLDSHLLKNSPKKLILITTGNIRNKELFHLLINNFNQIFELLVHHNLIEINTKEINGN